MIVDSEGCFYIGITNKGSENEDNIVKWSIVLRFIIDQKDEEEVLLKIKNLIGYGTVYLRKGIKKMFLDIL